MECNVEQNETIEMTVEMAYRDKTNKNGWRIPLCKLKEAFETERSKFLLESKTWAISDGYKYIEGIDHVELEHQVGVLLSVDLENSTARIQVKKQYKEEVMDNMEMALFISAKGTFTNGLILDPAVLYCALMDKRKTCY